MAAGCSASDLRDDCSSRAPGIERLADRLRVGGTRLMASHHDRLMSSHHDRLMSSGTGAVMKPPPGINQPPNQAVTPQNVSAALADYERKKVMANKG